MDTYIMPQTLPVLVVGLAPRRLTLTRQPAFLVLPQASNANGGVICIGGSNVSIANGIELAAGQAFLLATMPSPQQQQMGGLGIGISRQLADASLSSTYMLFDMFDIWVVATAINQTLRVMFMSPPRARE
jgi:hypothetical protein